MGASVWTFLRRQPGELRPVAQRAVEQFISKAGCLPGDAEGFVRYVQVVVNLQNRRATEVLHVGFFQYRVLKNGRLHRKHFSEIMAAVPEAAFGWLQLTKPPPGVVGREGVAATALVLRWGSYLAALLDHDKPVWPEVDSPSTSRISDEEMARINIESSAALAEWIDIYRAERGGRVYEQLVNRAIAYLPMPKKTSRFKVTEVAALSEPGMAARLVEASRAADAARLARVREEVERHASRVLANALVNMAWRNGPVEDIHAGSFQGFPLDQRRVTLAEERDLMAFASERLALGMTICLQFSMERPPRSWAQQVLPYGLAEMMLITPSNWTLTEVSRDVRLLS